MFNIHAFLEENEIEIVEAENYNGVKSYILSSSREAKARMLTAGGALHERLWRTGAPVDELWRTPAEGRKQPKDVDLSLAMLVGCHTQAKRLLDHFHGTGVLRLLRQV